MGKIQALQIDIMGGRTLDIFQSFSGPMKEAIMQIVFSEFDTRKIRQIAPGQMVTYEVNITLNPQVYVAFSIDFKKELDKSIGATLYAMRFLSLDEYLDTLNNCKKQDPKPT